MADLRRGVKLTKSAARKVAKVVGIVENAIGDAPDGGSSTQHDVRLRWAELTADLAAASDGKTAPTTAAGKLLNRNRNTNALEDGREIEITNRNADYSASTGDVIPVTNIQGQWTPVLGASSVGGGGFDGDSCECSTELIEGLELEGEPTLCCRGHDHLTADFGPLIGTLALLHQGDDAWSTFSEDEEEDNPRAIAPYWEVW